MIHEAVFNLFEEADDFERLASNPRIVIENRALQYVFKPGDEELDIPDEELLFYKIKYTRHSHDISPENLFLSTRLAQVPTGSQEARERLAKFLESPNNSIRSKKTTMRDDALLVFIEYIDESTHYINENAAFSDMDIRGDGKLSFDPETGQYIIEEGR